MLYFDKPDKRIPTTFLLCSFLVIFALVPGYPAAENTRSSVTYNQAAEFLESGDLDAQYRGIDALVQSRDARASNMLMELVQSPDIDVSVRMEAAHGLGILGDPTVVHALIKALQEDFEDRTGIWAGIIPALGDIGHEDAIPVLLDALNNLDEHWLGREMAARALGQIGSATAVPALLDAAGRSDTHHAAIVALARMRDSRATSVFIDALNVSEDTETVEAASKALAILGQSSLDEIINAFLTVHPENPDTVKRIRLCRLLGESNDESAIETLENALQDEKDTQVKACIKEQMDTGR